MNLIKLPKVEWIKNYQFSIDTFSYELWIGGVNTSFMLNEEFIANVQGYFSMDLKEQLVDLIVDCYADRSVAKYAVSLLKIIKL